MFLTENLSLSHPNLRINLSTINLMCASGIVAHTNRQITQVSSQVSDTTINTTRTSKSGTSGNKTHIKLKLGSSNTGTTDWWIANLEVLREFFIVAFICYPSGILSKKKYRDKREYISYSASIT